MTDTLFKNKPTHTNVTEADQAAQQHPEGNAPDQIESPEMGLAVNDGQPSGEQNGEERQMDAGMQGE